MRLSGQEFYDEQRVSRYPFADDADLMSSTGLSFPTDVFLDAVIYAVEGGVGYYLSDVYVAAGKVTLSVGRQGVAVVATGVFDPRQGKNTIALSDTYSRPAGLLIADPVKLAIFQTWPAGHHEFRRTSTEFVASCCIPAPEQCLRGLQLDDGTLFVNDVWLVGDGGVVVRQTEEGHVRVDAVGDPLFARRLCLPFSELFVTPQFLRTINHIGPDAYGGFTLTVGSQVAPETILRIYPDGNNTLVIEVVGQNLTDQFQ